MAEEVKAERKQVGSVNIKIYDDGIVNVEGPLKNPYLMLAIFGKAQEAVANYNPDKDDAEPAADVVKH